MNKLYLNNLQSVKEFERNLKKTYKLVTSILSNIIATEAFITLTVKKREITNYDKKMMRQLSTNKREKNQIFEMGYIALFSHFEFFMYDFLKDLYVKFPKSLNIDLSFDEIRDISSVKKIIEYVIDTAAIRKSYDIDSWLEYLKNTYDVNILSDKQDRTRLHMLNEYRNIIMHTGGKTNVRFSKKMTTILKSKIPIGEKFDLDMQKFFNILYQFFKDILRELKKL